MTHLRPNFDIKKELAGQVSAQAIPFVIARDIPLPLTQLPHYRAVQPDEPSVQVIEESKEDYYNYNQIGSVVEGLPASILIHNESIAIGNIAVQRQD